MREQIPPTPRHRTASVSVRQASHHQGLTTTSVNGAHQPERTVPAPGAVGRSSSSLRPEAAVAQGCKSTLALEKNLKNYFAELNRHPKPIQWTYTKTKLMAKFGVPQPTELAA